MIGFKWGSLERKSPLDSYLKNDYIKVCNKTESPRGHKEVLMAFVTVTKVTERQGTKAKFFIVLTKEEPNREYLCFDWAVKNAVGSEVDAYLYEKNNKWFMKLNSSIKEDFPKEGAVKESASNRTSTMTLAYAKDILLGLGVAELNRKPDMPLDTVYNFIKEQLPLLQKEISAILES